MTHPLPIFWSFRRCPYAMRARLAILSAGIRVEHREILLKAKPDEFLATSASGTVPTLKVGVQVIDESRDIMLWALHQSDPDALLSMPESWKDLIEECDGPFKSALDHTKYAVRFPNKDEQEEREKASVFLRKLDDMLDGQPYIYGHHKTLVDLAILPFVRQFANTDRQWFDAQNWQNLIHWLDAFLDSAAFNNIMAKHRPWQPQQDPVVFPNPI